MTKYTQSFRGVGGALGTCTPIERGGGGGGIHRYPQRKGGAGIHRIGTGTHIERGQVHIEGP